MLDAAEAELAASGRRPAAWPIGQPGGAEPGVAFLAPLDPLAWDRDLLLRLWDFDYRWEVYVPAAKRRWGYYVLPLLYGDRFVGRIEPRIDRKAGVLRILGLWWEDGFDPLGGANPGFVGGRRGGAPRAPRRSPACVASRGRASRATGPSRPPSGSGWAPDAPLARSRAEPTPPARCYPPSMGIEIRAVAPDEYAAAIDVMTRPSWTARTWPGWPSPSGTAGMRAGHGSPSTAPGPAARSDPGPRT